MAHCASPDPRRGLRPARSALGSRRPAGAPLAPCCYRHVVGRRELERTCRRVEWISQAALHSVADRAIPPLTAGEVGHHWFSRFVDRVARPLVDARAYARTDVAGPRGGRSRGGVPPSECLGCGIALLAG